MMNVEEMEVFLKACSIKLYLFSHASFCIHPVIQYVIPYLVNNTKEIIVHKDTSYSYISLSMFPIFRAEKNTSYCFLSGKSVCRRVLYNITGKLV